MKTPHDSIQSKSDDSDDQAYRAKVADEDAEAAELAAAEYYASARTPPHDYDHEPDESFWEKVVREAPDDDGSNGIDDETSPNSPTTSPTVVAEDAVSGKPDVLDTFVAAMPSSETHLVVGAVGLNGDVPAPRIGATDDAGSKNVAGQAPSSPDQSAAKPIVRVKRGHHTFPGTPSRLTWPEIHEMHEVNRLAREAMRKANPWSRIGEQDADSDWNSLPPYLRRRKPTKVEERFDLEPGIAWVPVFDEIFCLVPRFKLTVLDLETLLTIVMVWLYDEDADEFLLSPKQLEERLYEDPRRIEDSFLRLHRLGLLTHRTGGLKNRTTVGVQPLRHVVSGTTVRFLQRAHGKDMRRVWGFSDAQSMRFFPVPERLMECLSSISLPDRARLAFYWLLHLLRKPDAGSVAVVDTAAAAKWMRCSPRTVRRALADLVASAAVRLVTHEDGLWSVDISPILDDIKPPPALRPSNRKGEEPECPKVGAE